MELCIFFNKSLESLLLGLVLRALDDLEPRDLVGAEVPEAVRVDIELEVPMPSSNNCLICKDWNTRIINPLAICEPGHVNMIIIAIAVCMAEPPDRQNLMCRFICCFFRTAVSSLKSYD